MKKNSTQELSSCNKLALLWSAQTIATLLLLHTFSTTFQPFHLSLFQHSLAFDDYVREEQRTPNGVAFITQTTSSTRQAGSRVYTTRLAQNHYSAPLPSSSLPKLLIISAGWYVRIGAKSTASHEVLYHDWHTTSSHITYNYYFINTTPYCPHPSSARMHLRDYL